MPENLHRGLHPEVKGDVVRNSGVVAGKGQSIDTMASAATHFWTDEKTRFMLTQVQELNILKFMDGRKTRISRIVCCC